MLNKAYVVKENLELRRDLSLVIDDIIFVGTEPAPEKSGLKVISPEEFTLIPSGYVEPAIDSQVQTAARDKATVAVEKVRAAAQAARDAVGAAKQNRAQEIDRLDSEVASAEFRASLVEGDLAKAEAEYEAKLKVFGAAKAVVELHQADIAPFVDLGLTERQAGILVKAGYTSVERARLLGDNDLISLGLSQAAVTKLRDESDED